MRPDESHADKPTRRGFLRWAAVTAGALATPITGLPRLLLGDYDETQRGSRTGWARLKFPCAAEAEPDWGLHPSGDFKVIQQIRADTSINLSRSWFVADIDDLKRMCDFPFIFAHGQQYLRLNPRQQADLAEYLKRGGFLFVDDCVLDPLNPAAADLFYRSMVENLQAALPDAKWEVLDVKHEVFRAVYNLPNGSPHLQGVNHGLRAVHHKGRMVALAASGDLHCGWVGVNWFPPEKERDALRMAVNIYTYAVTH